MSNTKIEEFILSLPNWIIEKIHIIPVGWDPCPNGYDVLSLEYNTSDGYVYVQLRHKNEINIFDQNMYLTPKILKEIIKINSKFVKLMQHLEVTGTLEEDFT